MTRSTRSATLLSKAPVVCSLFCSTLSFLNTDYFHTPPLIYTPLFSHLLHFSVPANMAVGKLVNFFALSSLAVLVCNLGVTPVTALSAHGAHMHRRDLTHGAVAKRSRGKRDNSKRCKTRSSTAVESSTAAAAPSSTDTPAATTTQAQASTSVSVSTSTSAAPAASSSSISSGSGGKIGIAWGGGTTSQLDGLLTSNVK